MLAANYLSRYRSILFVDEHQRPARPAPDMGHEKIKD
jgi:hypothetical protein